MSSRAAEVTFLKRSSSSVIVVSLCPGRREGGKEDVTHPYMVHLTAAKNTPCTTYICHCEWSFSHCSQRGGY